MLWLLFVCVFYSRLSILHVNSIIISRYIFMIHACKLRPAAFLTCKAISRFFNQLCMTFRAGGSTLTIISVRSSFTFSSKAHGLSSKRQLLGMESSSSLMSSSAVLLTDRADVYTGRIHTDDPFLPVKGKRDESIIFSIRQ